MRKLRLACESLDVAARLYLLSLERVLSGIGLPAWEDIERQRRAFHHAAALFAGHGRMILNRSYPLALRKE